MSERTYLFFVGVFILAALFFEANLAMLILCAWLTSEGIFNIRFTKFIQKMRGVDLAPGLTFFQNKPRFVFTAYRAWRLSVATFLSASFVLITLYNIEELWFFPWFMGFAIMGAGVSGVCPMLLFLRWLGFR